MAETKQERQNHADVIERLRERNKGLQNVIRRLNNEKRTLQNAMDDMETERDDALDKVMEREEELGAINDYATDLEYEREDDKREIGELRRLLRDARALGMLWIFELLLLRWGVFANLNGSRSSKPSASRSS